MVFSGIIPVKNNCRFQGNRHFIVPEGKLTFLEELYYYTLTSVSWHLLVTLVRDR